MTPHAKASSAGSILRQASRLGRIFRGALATRAPSLRGPGSGAPSAGILAALLAAIAILLTSAAPAAAESCPNEARREEQGAAGRALPDCRAYEIVTPQDAEFGRVTDIKGTQAAVGGGRLGWRTTSTIYPGSPTAGLDFLSSRGANGWTSQPLIPSQSVVSGLCEGSAEIMGYSPDLSKAVLMDGLFWTGYPKPAPPLDESGAQNCSHDEPLLAPGEPQGVANLFLRDNEAGSYSLLDLNQPAKPHNSYFQAGSADFSHVVFSSAAQLTPEAPLPAGQIGSYSRGEDLYEYAGGAVHLVTFLPDGTPVWGELANAVFGEESISAAGYTHPVSADGEGVLFYNLEPVYEGERVKEYAQVNLYLRQNAAQPQSAISAGRCTEAAKACTVQVDEKNTGAPGPGGGGKFRWASSDGSRVFFVDENKLTTDSTAAAGKPDLYEYDTEKPAGSRLADLTANAGEPADVRGLAGISADGAYVYFVAAGDLTGTQQNSNGDTAQAGQANLYLRHAGATAYIATLKPFATAEEEEEGAVLETCDWNTYTKDTQEANNGRGQPCDTSRVSTDGAFLAFNSRKSLTGYANTVLATGKPSSEIFLYDAASGKLSCASCDPSGAPPTAQHGFEQAQIAEPSTAQGGWHPGHAAFLTRQLSDGGRVFFDTTNSLLPADTNEVFDVYQYENGELHLISTGASAHRSVFIDASASGDDVFLYTADSLVASDADNAYNAYDARVGGGFPEPPPTVACETEEACHARHQEPPASSTPGSAHFEGPGNALRCPRGFVKRRGGCAKVRRHSHKHRHRPARLNRRAGR